MTKSPKKVEHSGFIYRGKYAEVTLDDQLVRLVTHETYIMADLSNASDSGLVPVTLKKKGASLNLVITLNEYYKHISSGRCSFTDTDPYL